MMKLHKLSYYYCELSCPMSLIITEHPSVEVGSHDHHKSAEMNNEINNCESRNRVTEHPAVQVGSHIHQESIEIDK